MSAAALFLPGAGDFHIPVTVRLADLPRGKQLSAWLVYSAILDYLRRGRTELGERFTNRVLQQSPWLRAYSQRFIRKGLKTLEDLGIITRHRHHGRRTIKVIGRLRGRSRPEAKPRTSPDPKPPETPKTPRTGQAPRPTPPQPTDPETLLLQLKNLGWYIVPDGDGGVKKARAESSKLKWHEIEPDLLERVEDPANKAEIRAYVLANAPGAARPAKAATPTHAGRVVAAVGSMPDVMSDLEEKRRRTDAEEAERRHLAALLARDHPTPGDSAITPPARE